MKDFIWVKKRSGGVYYQWVVHDSDIHCLVHVRRIRFSRYFQRSIHSIENCYSFEYTEEQRWVMLSTSLMFRNLMIMLFHLQQLVDDQILEHDHYLIRRRLYSNHRDSRRNSTLERHIRICQKCAFLFQEGEISC